MNLHTKRLQLRPVEAKDLDDYFEFYQLEDVCQYLPNKPWTAENKTENFESTLSNINLENNSKLLLSVIYQEKAIGVIFIMPDEMIDTFEIGYVFNPTFSRQGFAFEAVSATFDYLFQIVKAHRIFANLDTRNIASMKLCEKLGMRREAHYIEDYWLKGEWTDSYIYGILNREWQKKKLLI